MIGCGNGGAGNAIITGTVAGTVEVAIDESDNEVDRDTATGSPKTFTLTVPGGNYRFYLIENEGTANERAFSLYQETTNVFTISSAITIDLGFVDTKTGKAVAENNPLDVPGVDSGGETTDIPDSLSDFAFTLYDLEGTWNFHELTSSDTPGWAYGKVTIDNSTVTFDSITRSSGDTTPIDPTSISITPSGIVTISADSTYHGVMSQDKNIIVVTLGDVSDGQYKLQIVQREGSGAFTQSDLQGTSYFHGLIASADYPAWQYGKITVDNSTVTLTP